METIFDCKLALTVLCVCFRHFLHYYFIFVPICICIMYQYMLNCQFPFYIWNYSFLFFSWNFPIQLIYPLDSRKTKRPKTKTADFFVHTCISVKFFQKKPKWQYHLLWKIPEITILFWVLVFSFMYLVSVDPTDR